MLVLLSAFERYLVFKTFSTFAWTLTFSDRKRTAQYLPGDIPGKTTLLSIATNISDRLTRPTAAEMRG